MSDTGPMVLWFGWLPWQPKGKIWGKNIQKSTPEAVWGIKLKFAELFLTLTSTKRLFLLLLLKLFGCYGNLKFPVTYNRKNDNWDLLLSHCRYFDKIFTEMFVEWSATKHIILVQTSQFVVAMATERLNLRKKYLKKVSSSEAILG